MKFWRVVPVLVASAVVMVLFGCSGSDSNDITASVVEERPTVLEGVASSSSTASGFLWKPVSESDGRLVILFPNALKGLVVSGAVHSDVPPSDENKIEEGRFTGDTHNGERPHYRFTRKGIEFGQNIFAVARLNDGTYEWWYIPEGANRTEM